MWRRYKDSGGSDGGIIRHLAYTPHHQGTIEPQQVAA
jgi:hypothetical protein